MSREQIAQAGAATKRGGTPKQSFDALFSNPVFQGAHSALLSIQAAAVKRAKLDEENAEFQRRENQLQRWEKLLASSLISSEMKQRIQVSQWYCVRCQTPSGRVSGCHKQRIATRTSRQCHASSASDQRLKENCFFFNQYQRIHCATLRSFAILTCCTRAARSSKKSWWIST